MLLENDGLVGPSGTAVVASLNGTEWSQLPDADHPTFSHVFGYKQIASAEGTLYVRPTGRAYYEHSGNDVVSLTHDIYLCIHKRWHCVTACNDYSHYRTRKSTSHTPFWAISTLCFHLLIRVIQQPVS